MSVKVTPKLIALWFVVNWSTWGERMLGRAANVGYLLATKHTVDVKFSELESSLVHTFFLNPDKVGIARGILQCCLDMVYWEWSQFFKSDYLDSMG